MNKKCTLLLSTCDSYEDTWLPFFKCLQKNWPNFNMPIVINTESKNYTYDIFNIKTFNLYKNQKVSWGKRLKEHLKRIDTEYIFFMLDDFFLTKTVNTKLLETCFKWMEENKDIAVFSFHRVDDKTNIKSEKYNGFEKRAKNGKYRLNCQAAIWRRKDLINLIKDNESPWDWEIYGSIRSRKYNKEFYSISYEIEEPLQYNMYNGGTGICRGKWVKDVVVPLFEKLNIEIDFTKRGFSELTPLEQKRTIKDKIICKLKKFQAYIDSFFIKNN